MIETNDLVRCTALHDTYRDREPYYGKHIYRVDYRLSNYLALDLGHGAVQRVLDNECELMLNENHDGLSEEGIKYMKTRNR